MPSASRSFLMICSGLCRVRFIESPPGHTWPRDSHNTWTSFWGPDEPDLVAPKQVLVEKVRLMRGHDHLLASAWTCFNEEFQKGIAKVWVEAPIQFVDYEHLAPCGKMVERRKQIQTSLRSV